MTYFWVLVNAPQSFAMVPKLRRKQNGTGDIPRKLLSRVIAALAKMVTLLRPWRM